MSSTQRWHAVYTKPRWEKKVFALLMEKGITAYCPLNKVRRRWSDRYKIINEPLFKSYVFVHITDEEMKKVRMIPGVVNFIYWNGKPAVIREKEINTIKKFLNEYEFVLAEPIRLMPNQRIKIMTGVLMNEEAVVIRSEKNKVQVILESLGFKLTAGLEKNEIQVI
ncbi:MAG: UpxY family transcription antiterminator [Chitinophagaceae bacterium]|nr:UpxY family transcription antiterminator [Chitinophagaceae bacterium]